MDAPNSCHSAPVTASIIQKDVGFTTPIHKSKLASNNPNTTMETVECSKPGEFATWLTPLQDDTVNEWKRQNLDDFKNFGDFTNRTWPEEAFNEWHDIRLSTMTDWRQSNIIEPFRTGWYRIQDKAHANNWIVPMPIDIAKDTQDESKQTTWIPKDYELLTEEHRETFVNDTKDKRQQSYRTTLIMIKLLYGDKFGAPELVHPVFVQIPKATLQSAIVTTSETMTIRMDTPNMSLCYRIVTKRILSGKFKRMDYLEVRVTSSTPKTWPPRQIATAWETAQGRVPRLIELINDGGRVKKEITESGKKRDGQQVCDDQDSQVDKKKAKAT